MKTLGAKEAKDNFGYLLDTAQSDLVTIAKKGRPVAVIMSLEQFERYEEAEDMLWAMRAKEASSEGFYSTDESEQLLKGLG